MNYLRITTQPKVEAHESGTTLLETLIAITISALVLASSAVQTNRLLHRQRLKRFVATLSYCLRGSQLMALQTGDKKSVVFSDSTISCPRISGQPYFLNLPEKTNYKLIAADENTLHFWPSGAFSPARITIESERVRCELKTALRGRITFICN